MKKQRQRQNPLVKFGPGGDYTSEEIPPLSELIFFVASIAFFVVCVLVAFSI